MLITKNYKLTEVFQLVLEENQDDHALLLALHDAALVSGRVALAITIKKVLQPNNQVDLAKVASAIISGR